MVDSAGTLSTVVAAVAIVGTSLLAALALTRAARALALRVGAVTHPSSDRWPKPPTPLLGGIAIAVATAAGLATATLLVGDGWAVRPERAAAGPALGLAASAIFMLVVGLTDDLGHIRPQLKFLLQLLAGVTLVSRSYR